ncbi:NAP1-related protein 1-like isoform X1 [Olea europaea var. sylvestris]|uniref:NAP1-related protein 1-like isoform X1 n=1 Tax=Olea europaea var. sylvestris TaxID=158386 RepID=UPI000C1D161D|nr:NAP1-related protein 1-like isoform X1 [Olea europaea var. sylvestris]
MVADRSKKPKTADKLVESAEEDNIHNDKDLLFSLEKLQDFQNELDKVNEEASDKVLEVERKYNEIRRPVYVRRNEIISSIPDFWLTALLSHPSLCDLLSEEDQMIFKYLDALDVDDDLKLGYSITFKFKPNPFFENTKLIKTSKFYNRGPTKITGTKIDWKEGMGSANIRSDEKKGNKRPPSTESFFSWFSETQLEDAGEGLHDEVADIIKEDLWPDPIKYLYNVADDEDSEEDEEEGEEGDEYDDDED